MEFRMGQKVRFPDGRQGRVIKKQGNDYVARTYDGRLVGFDNHSLVTSLEQEEKREGMVSSESTISGEGQREPLEDSGDKVSDGSSNAGFLEEDSTKDQKGSSSVSVAVNVETPEQRAEREAKEKEEALKIREKAQAEKLERIRKQQEINE